MKNQKGKEPYRMFRHYHMPETMIPSVTICVEEVEKDVGYKVSWAICSLEDNFSRSEGRRVAIETAKHRYFSLYRTNVDGDFDIFSEIERTITGLPEMDDILGKPIRQLRDALFFHLIVASLLGIEKPKIRKRKKSLFWKTMELIEHIKLSFFKKMKELF